MKQEHQNDQSMIVDIYDEDGDDGHEKYYASLSNLNRCSGSAMFTFGDNIVQCSVFGPNPVTWNQNVLKKNYLHILLYPLGQIRNFFKGMCLFSNYIIVRILMKNWKFSTTDKSLSYYEYFFKRTLMPLIYNALLPNSRTYLVLNEIEKGSSFLSTSLNAMMLALLDSGHPLNHCIACSGFVLDRRDQQLYSEIDFIQKCTKSIRLLEPCNLTLNNCESIKATFLISNKNTKTAETISILAEGKFSLQNVFDARKKSTKTSAKFLNFTREKIGQSFIR